MADMQSSYFRAHEDRERARVIIFMHFNHCAVIVYKRDAPATMSMLAKENIGLIN